MTGLSIELHWMRKTPSMDVGGYDTDHEISFNDHDSLTGDAAPDWGGERNNVNPEQMLAAALSSCHMMTFLSLAARAKLPIATYSDHAVSVLGKLPNGRMAVTDILLSPRVTLDTGFSIEPGELEKMHTKTHKLCFVANSISARVRVTPVV